ncbi:hypothetical protein RB195_013705 [Necator americanus]|uniref:Uncharacterized protein n=1 Tax=Necator americanus TaxID=51031 RepID=A0ABR1DZK9_NECAM
MPQSPLSPLHALFQLSRPPSSESFGSVQMVEIDTRCIEQLLGHLAQGLSVTSPTPHPPRKVKSTHSFEIGQSTIYFGEEDPQPKKSQELRIQTPRAAKGYDLHLIRRELTIVLSYREIHETTTRLGKLTSDIAEKPEIWQSITEMIDAMEQITTTQTLVEPHHPCRDNIMSSRCCHVIPLEPMSSRCLSPSLPTQHRFTWSSTYVEQAMSCHQSSSTSPSGKTFAYGHTSAVLYGSFRVLVKKQRNENPSPDITELAKTYAGAPKE